MARTKRAPYTGAKRHMKGCRNHGSCSWCEGNRTHASAKAEEQAKVPRGVFEVEYQHEDTDGTGRGE